MQGEIFTFLTVEDDLKQASNLKEIIVKHLGDVTKVIIAGTNKAAFEFQENHYFDAYFVDLNLPDGRGSDFIRQIRKTQPRHPIIVVSVDKGLEIKFELLHGMKVQGYLEKDYKEEDVTAELDLAVETAREIDDTELSFRDETGVEKIRVRNIAFVRMVPNSKKARVGIYDFHTKEFRIELFSVRSLASVLKKCRRKNSLIQCQKGCLVNPSFIKRYEIDDEELVLHYTDVKLPVGGGQFKKNIKLYVYV